jgi:flagellar hook-associated protein 1 FlgK
MAGLISSLHNSSGALRVHSKGLEVVGKNLANVNNPAYAKQRVSIGDRGQINSGIATESMGVEAMELRQNRDTLLDKSVMRELNATSGLEAAKKVLQSAETALGQFLDRTKDSTSIQNAPGSNGGSISDALTDFFNAWESFSVKPNDSAEKQLLIAKAQILVDKINATDTRLSQVQSDVDQQLKSDVDVVNQLLSEIAKTNEYIAKAELVKPFSAVDLRDQRQAKLEQLSKYMDIQFGPVEVDPNANPPTIDPNGLGQIVVRAGGQVLVDRNAVAGQSTGDSGKVIGPFSYDATNRAIKYDLDGEGSAAPIDFISNGSLQSQINAAYVNVQSSRDDIALLARAIADGVNSIYEGTQGNPNTFFIDPPTSGLITFNSNVTVSTLKGSAKTGANDVALALAALGTDAIAGLGPNTTFAAHFNKTVTTLAQELNSTNIRLEDQKLAEEMALNSRDQYSGVSQDEEITDMMKFQRSFQASARHINIIDTLLDQIVNRLGVG